MNNKYIAFYSIPVGVPQDNLIINKSIEITVIV